MPIYEYRCRQCSKVVELLVGSSTADGGISCPECGSEDLKRLFSLFSARSNGAAKAGAPSGGGGCCGGGCGCH